MQSPPCIIYFAEEIYTFIGKSRHQTHAYTQTLTLNATNLLILKILMEN